jgi:tritrans,polycis-undecaprenyl-diphosphate synthase [geranylgeranyl-diphosphate specific]
MERVPRHIAIIMDGNRRFAKALMMKPWMGHEWGRKKIEKVIDWCDELKVKELTLYAFSVQNFSRPKEEFDYLMNVFIQACEDLLIDERVYKNKIKVRFIGRIAMFPEKLHRLMCEVMEKTKDHDGFLLNFAMAYGGREEVIDAVHMLSAEIKEGKVDGEHIDEAMFEKFLYMKDAPDMIIRTGGEQRISNFLIWQANYAELFFLEKKWPEFEKEDLIACIDEFNQRERRFGK